MKTLQFNFGRGLSRINEIRDFLDNTAERAYGILRVAANVADGERVSIGSDDFEVDIINTDTAVNTASGQWNNTTNPIVVTITSHGLIVGDLVRVESELFRVVSVVDANTVKLSRGACGTTVAAHADGLDIFKSNTPNAIVSAGDVPVGLDTTLTPAVFTARLTGTINDKQGTDRNSNLCVAVNVNANTVLLVARKRGVLELSLTETLAGAGNAWDFTPMRGGIAAGRRRYLTGTRTPSDAEVTAGQVIVPLDFDPVVTLVQVITSAGVDKGWNGAITTVAASGNSPAYVIIDNSGTIDWATTDKIHYVFSE